MTEQPTRVVSSKDFRAFPRKVRDALAILINEHGVRWRFQGNNASHVLLYNNGTGRPFKLAASRPEETQMRYLQGWVEKNVPDFGLNHVEDTITSTAEIVDFVGRAQKAQVAVDEIIKDTQVVVPQRDWLTFGERTSEFLYLDGATIRCIACDYTSAEKRGSHLHENKHNGRAAELARNSAQQRVANNAAKREALSNAVLVMAEHVGLTVSTHTDEEVIALKEQVEALHRVNEALVAERDEARARLALIKEAMKL